MSLSLFVHVTEFTTKRHSMVVVQQVMIKCDNILAVPFAVFPSDLCRMTVFRPKVRWLQAWQT